MKGVNLYLQENELMFVATAVSTLLEQFKKANSDDFDTWDPKAKKYLKEMLAAGSSVKIKLSRLGLPMDDIEKLDEDGNLLKKTS